MLPTRDEEIIVAQCTPSGNGALAIVRVSGAQAIVLVQKCAKLYAKKKLTDVASHTIHLGTVIDQHNHVIDQVLFLVMKGPKSFTGQDTVEISCHNNPFVIEAIIQQLIAHGARPAQHGEFTKRAFLNKKLDLIQAEAIHDLINAHTQQAIKHSLAQLAGSFSYWISELEQQLIKAHSLCQASFEFIEDDINFDHNIKNLVYTSLKQIQQLQQHQHQQQRIKEGVRIAIIGAVNAGKSSLFNALLKKDRAIVTPIAGTTRDTIEAGIFRNNMHYTLVDTAGFRTTKNKIEQEGITRAYQEAALADIILLSIDASCPIMPQEKKWYQKILTHHGKKTIVIFTKSDIAPHMHHEFAESLTVSATTGHHMHLLENIIIERTTRLLQANNCPFLVNKRQAQLLHSLEMDLKKLIPLLDQTLEYEILCVHLKDALEKITELTGKTIGELSLDRIFQDFCIGK